MSAIAILLCVAIYSVLSAPILDDLVIELPDGQVQGTTYVTKTNKTYYGFQGIPYATPPTGSLRFEIPQPPQPWDGIWDATKDSKACLSVSHAQNPDGESEDCLYVNVYTTVVESTSQLPVMFWIYGGSFTSGSSAKSIYGPDFIVEQDVILVSFNYRLGPFGFISTGDSAFPGNVGLKDQNLALKWTHENIKYFGGDPEKITIFGQSAGGASTGLQVLSKKSAGLFRAAILESGSALTYWTIDLNPKAYAVSLVEALNGENYENETQKLKEFLLEKTSEEILNATITLASAGEHAWPVLEVDGEDAFVTESPYELLASGRFNQVPIIIGICSEESLMFLQNLEYTRQVAAALDSDPSMLIPTDLRPNSSNVDAVIEEVHNIYVDYNETFSNDLLAVIKLYSDNGFTRGVIKHAEVAASLVPVYLYQFSYYGRVITEAFMDGADKAGHAAELPFIFKYGSLSDSTDPTDLLTQNRMVSLWTNFAKFLNPTPEPSELLDNITWPIVSPLAPLNLQYLNINSTVELQSNPKWDTYSKWNDIYQHYAKRPFVTF